MKNSFQQQKKLPSIRESMLNIIFLTLQIIARKIQRGFGRFIHALPSLAIYISEGILAVLQGICIGLGMIARMMVITVIQTSILICKSLGQIQVHPNLLIPFTYGILALTLTLVLAYLPELFSSFKVFDFYFFKLRLNQTFSLSIVIILLALLVATQNKGLGQLEWFSENNIEHFPKSNWLNATGIRVFHAYSAIVMGIIAGVVLAAVRLLFI